MVTGHSCIRIKVVGASVGCLKRVVLCALVYVLSSVVEGTGLLFVGSGKYSLHLMLRGKFSKT